MTMLIDSILHNYYMPPIIFCVKNDPETRRPIERICIDGKQRLTSIQRFMDGDLPHKDAVTGKKLWFQTNGIRGRKQIPEDMKKSFESTSVVCVEYDDLDEKEERELFSRVQNGIALTPAERMQAFNGPYPDLIRTVGKEVTKCFGDQLNWGKLRGRDFRSIAQILYLIEYSTAKGNIIPPEPSTAKVETWLNSKVTTPIPDDVKKSARTVFLLLCVLVLDIDEEGWGKPFRAGPHKFSPIEFVLSAYMIFLYGQVLTITQLSVGVKYLRDHARKGKDELRFNSATYKDLVKYVRKEVKDVVLGVTEDEGVHVPSAFEWAGANGRRIQDAVESSKTTVKSKGLSTLPLILPASSKRKRKATAKADQDGDSEMGAEDSDVPLLNLVPKRTRDVGQELNPLKTRKLTQDSSVSTPARSVSTVVKIEKSTAARKKRKKPDDDDHVDDKVTKKRKAATSSAPSQSTPGPSKRSQTASEFPSVIAAPGVPSNTATSPSVVASGSPVSSTLPSFRKSSKKVSSIFISPTKKPQIQQSPKPGITSTLTHTSSVAECSVLPSGAGVSRKDGGKFPTSALANSPVATSSTHEALAQTPVQEVSSPSLSQDPGWTPPQYPVNRPPSRLSLLRQTKQRIEFENQATKIGGHSTVPSSALAPGPTRDPRVRRNASGPATPPQSPRIASPQPNINHNQLSLGCVPRNPNQSEQRPVHPGSGLPSPLQTPTPPSPIIMSNPPPPSQVIVTTASPEPEAGEMNSYRNSILSKTLPAVLPDAGLPQRPLTPPPTNRGRDPVKSRLDTPSRSPPVPTAPPRRDSSHGEGNSSHRGYLPPRYDYHSPRRQYDNYSPRRQRDYDRYPPRRCRYDD